MPILKKIAAQLPERLQTELKRLYFGRQIKNNTFITDEPEFKILSTLIKPGDWIIDIGANVGHYTKRFSELAGPRGRILAFEPIPTTFSLLAANTQLFPSQNVSLFNAAVSDKLEAAGMTMPKFSSGLKNYYQAHISPASDCDLSVLTIPIDSLCINQHVALIKIDAEGHESFVLNSIQELIKKHHPVLIVETDSNEVITNLELSGYIPERLPNSPNVLFKPDIMKNKPIAQ